MAGLPSFLQAMFTPTGPPRQRVDQGGGEYTGSIGGVYEGDDSSPVFPRSITSRSVSGPTTRRLPDPLPGTGGGPSPLAQIGRDMKHLAGSGGDDGVDMTSITETALEPGGMSSISEIMQGQAGEMSPMGYQPFDPMGSGTDRMLGDSRFGGGMQTPPAPSNFGGPTPDELGIGGGGAGSDLPNMTYYNNVLPIDAGQGDYRGSTGHWYSEADKDQEGMPASYNRVGRRDPTAAVGDWLGEVFSGAGPTPTPGIGVGQTDPATGVPALVSGGPMSEFFSNIWERGTGGGTPVPTPGIQPGQTDPALGVPAPLDGHWPEWLQSMFARSTTGGSGRGPRVRR